MTSFTNNKPYNPTANTENAAVRPLLYPRVRVGERKKDGGRVGIEDPIRGKRRVELGVKKVLDKEAKRQMGYSNVESGRSVRELEEGVSIGVFSDCFEMVPRADGNVVYAVGDMPGW